MDLKKRRKRKSPPATRIIVIIKPFSVVLPNAIPDVYESVDERGKTNAGKGFKLYQHLFEKGGT